MADFLGGMFVVYCLICTIFVTVLIGSIVYNLHSCRKENNVFSCDVEWSIEYNPTQVANDQ